MRSLRLTSVVVAISAIIIDQLSKLFIIKEIPITGIFLFQTKALSLQFVQTINENIAFGLEVPSILIYILFVIVFGLLVLFASKEIRKNNLPQALALGLVMGGAMSNMLDRISRNGVFDFISISIYNFNWPTFNLADAIIVVAVIIYLIKQPKANI